MRVFGSIARLAILISAILAGPLTAAAETAPAAAACGGSDILAELKHSDPDDFSAITAEAESEANHTGLFWRIDGAGTAPSYLFGTMHLSDPRLVEFPAPLRQALDGARVIAVEVAEIAATDEAAMMSGFMKNIGLLLLGPKGVLDDYLSEAEMAALGAATENYGLPLSVARSLQPWMVATFLALPLCELHLQQNGHPALDSVVAAHAINAGAELVGLETIDEQIAAMNSLDFGYQIAYLRAGIELFDRVDDIHETMVQLYLDERVAMVVPLSFHLVSDPAIRDGYADFQDKLVDRRNRLMFERALPHVHTGGTVIAVGALHLPGETGLIELFRKQGLTVTRIDLSTAQPKER